jgi:hypothetical protein
MAKEAQMSVTEDGVAATVIAKGATGVTYGSLTVAGIVAWINSLDWIALGGFTIGVVTAVVNLRFKRRQEERAKQKAADEHEESLQRQRLNELETQLRMLANGVQDDTHPKT